MQVLSSLYDDTSSETSQVNTPKRRKHVTMNTPRVGGLSTGKTPYKSPYMTPLRSSVKKNPIVQQVHATMDLCIRVFTSNILFISTIILLPVFLGLLLTKVYPYWTSENCNFENQYRVRYFCIDESNTIGNFSKTITRIVKQQRPQTFDELYELVYEKDKVPKEYVKEAIQYCDEVALFNDKIYYKLSDNAEVFILTLLSIIVAGLFVTCCIFKIKRRFSY
ncbi:hypothetical protein M9Y10_045094 [Tritrichomonas musculus]|uniref:Uncharacterized protein n=1 Tax=Tritrichomonas musculus TaxID=1915356 RepID=A0ABR2JW64_9EUKA